MIILSVRTDKPEAEVGLFDDQNKLDYIVWQAHRELSDTIHVKTKSMLDDHDKKWADIEGIVFYQGPGSFTGLRIGASVVNALAETLAVPVVSMAHDAWLAKGVERLLAGDNDKQVVPEYGAAPHITQQKK